MLVATSMLAGALAVASSAAVNPAVTSYAPAYFASASPTTALDMVALIPGFTFDKGNVVRGFGGAAGNVLIDGTRPASKDDGLEETLKRIPASSVLRIDLIRGGASGIDMQGKAVIANVVRRTDAGAKLLLAFSTSRDFDGRLAPAFRAEGSTKNGQTTLEGSLKLSRGFDQGAGDGPRTRARGDGSVIAKAAEVGKGSGTEDKLTGALETPVFGGRLRLNASLSSSPFLETQSDSYPALAGGEFERVVQGQDTGELGGRYERMLAPKLSSETFLLQQFGRGGEIDDFRADPTVAAATGDDRADLFLFHKTTSESIFRTKLRYEATRAVTLEAGVEGDYNVLNARTSFLQNGAPVAIPAANVQVNETRGEAFASAVWTTTPRLTLEGELRVEASRIGSSGDIAGSQAFAYPKPRLALTWSPDAADQLRLRLEREVGQLDFNDFAANSGNLSTGDVHAGNPRLRPQTDWVFEGAYERHFWRGGDATVMLRHFELSDVIDRAPVVSSSGEFDSPGNIGSGREDELTFTLTLPTDRLALKRGLLTGRVVFRSSDVIDPTTHAPRPISLLHSSYWDAHFTQGLPRLKSTWGFDIDGPFIETSYRYNEVDTDKKKFFAVLFAEYKPRPDLIIRSELRDVSGQAFEHARMIYATDRVSGVVSSADVRDLHNGPAIYFRITKTFGG